MGQFVKFLDEVFGRTAQRASARNRPWSRSDLESYRASVEKKARSTVPDEVWLTREPYQVAAVLAELLRTARSEVCLFGDPLPKLVFHSTPFRSALSGFFLRNPEGRMTVITNDPDFTLERMASYTDYPLDPEDLARLTILPMLPEHRSRMLCRFMYVDTAQAPSYWLNNFESEHRRPDYADGMFKFRDSFMTETLRSTFVRAAASFGSLVRA